MKTSNKILVFGYLASLILFAAVVAVFSSNMLPFKLIRGDGNIIERSVEVADFYQISNKTNFKVILKQGEKKVRIVTDKNLQEFVEIEESDGILRITPTNVDRVKPSGETLIYVQNPTIIAVEQTQGGIIEANSLITGTELRVTANDGGRIYLNKLDVPNLSTRTTGSGFMYLAGVTDNFTATSTDAGRIHAEDLQTREARFHFTDSAHLRVKVSEVLTGEATDAASVSYVGEPKLQVTQREGAKVSRWED